MKLANPFRLSLTGSLRGIALLLVGILIISIQDVIVKLISGDYGILQIVVIRSVFSLPLVYLILRWNGSGLTGLRSETVSLQLWRGFTMFLAYLLFTLALTALPFSLTISIFFAGPLFITMLSVPLLGESVGWRRWAAVLVGFCGVMLIVNPTAVDFDPAAFFALASAFMYAISIILTRKMDDHASTTLAYTTFAYLVPAILLTPVFTAVEPASTHPSLIFLTKAWTMPTTFDIGLIFVISVCWAIGMVLLTAAYHTTAVAVLAPFEYFSIFYGLLLGFLIWGEVPTTLMIVGLAIIIGCGLYIIYREQEADEIEPI